MEVQVIIMCLWSKRVQKPYSCFHFFLMCVLHLFMLWQEVKASSESLIPVSLKFMVAPENKDYLYF